MRLGIVMTGTGALAAANVGVLRLISERGIPVHAVCGVQCGAWIGALHAAGYDVRDMEKTFAKVSAGAGRLFRAQHAAQSLTSGKRAWLCEGKGIDHLLKVQTGEMLLGLCVRRAIFPCRIASSGKRVIFATRAYACGRLCEMTQQATVGFAARAAMANPPFLAPLPWAGSWLLPEEDTSWAAQQLTFMGADCVLIIVPHTDGSRGMDALELAAAHRSWQQEGESNQAAYVLRTQMPPGVHALEYRKMAEIVQAGYDAAQARLDAALMKLGMTQCRILPFRARAQLELGRR